MDVCYLCATRITDTNPQIGSVVFAFGTFPVGLCCDDSEGNEQ